MAIVGGTGPNFDGAKGTATILWDVEDKTDHIFDWEICLEM